MMNISVILVGIEGGVNLGLITRVTDNFEVGDIRLVDPKLTDEDWELAEIFASKAKNKLGRIKIFKTLDTALEDIDLAFATSSKTATRGSDFRRRFITPKEAVEIISNTNKKVGFVFGRESTGLTNKELEKCDLLVYIPTSKLYRALNLSHSVAIILYEVYVNKKHGEKRELASREVRELLIDSFKELTYYTTRNKEYSLKAIQAFKNVINRGRPDTREAKVILGTLRKSVYLLSKYLGAKTIK